MRSVTAVAGSSSCGEMASVFTARGADAGDREAACGTAAAPPTTRPRPVPRQKPSRQVLESVGVDLQFVLDLAGLTLVRVGHPVVAALHALVDAVVQLVAVVDVGHCGCCSVTV